MMKVPINKKYISIYNTKQGVYVQIDPFSSKLIIEMRDAIHILSSFFIAIWIIFQQRNGVARRIESPGR